MFDVFVVVFGKIFPFFRNSKKQKSRRKKSSSQILAGVLVWLQQPIVKQRKPVNGWDHKIRRAHGDKGCGWGDIFEWKLA